MAHAAGSPKNPESVCIRVNPWLKVPREDRGMISRAKKSPFNIARRFRGRRKSPSRQPDSSPLCRNPPRSCGSILRPAKVGSGVICRFFFATRPSFLLFGDFFSRHALLFCCGTIFFHDMPLFSVIGPSVLPTWPSFLLFVVLFSRHGLLFCNLSFFFRDMPLFSVIWDFCTPQK